MIGARMRMDGVDAAWLRMDKPINPMVINGVFVLAERCTLRQVRALFGRHFLKHTRFRSVPVQEAVGAAWLEDPSFDLAAHVGTLSLPAGAGQAELEALVGEQAGRPLDPRRPLWHIDLVPRYRRGSAVLLRIHHCYADGIALVRVILGLTTRARGAVPDDLEEASGAPPPEAPLGSWLGPAAQWFGQTLQGGGELIQTGLRWLGHPLDALGEGRQALGIAAEVGALLLLPDEPPGPLRGALGEAKRVAWAPPLKLAEVRTISHVLGCTINDVLLSVVAGTLGQYLQQHGECTDELILKATLPVNMRADDAPALGNRFGMVVLGLPVGIAHPFERLHAVQASMRALKQSQQPAAVLATLSALGNLPASAQDMAIEILSRKASVVISNVPGPREPLYLCGKRILEMHFWVPQSGSIGLGISILSYAGEVHFGLIADAGLIADPHRIVDAFGAEFERLLLLTTLGAAPAG